MKKEISFFGGIAAVGVNYKNRIHDEFKRFRTIVADEIRKSKKNYFKIDFENNINDTSLL